MSLKNIRTLASLLGLIVTATIIWYRSWPSALVAGIAFLMAAEILCLICVAVTLKVRKGITLEGKFSFIYNRAYVVLLAAWQVAIVGALSIFSVILSTKFFHLLVDYTSALLYCVCSYKILSLADSAKQEGGYKPVSFFGYPRSRKLLFVLFAGCSTIFPLTIMSLEDAASTGWRPIAFQPSQACLLMVAIMSVMSAGLIYQRYHGIVTMSKTRHAKATLGVTLLFLVCVAVIQQIVPYGRYVSVLSAIAIIGCAVSLSFLWQIGENTQDIFGSSYGGSVSAESRP
jgi:hypothetical protein